MGSKKKIALIIIFIILIISIATVTFGFYYQSVNIHFNTQFEANIQPPDSGYVRATIVTDWINSSNDIVAKNPWELNESVVSSNWVKKDDGYYYYKNGIPIEGKSNTELISIIDNDPVLPANLSASQVSTSSLSNPLYTARYKVIYEMLLDDPNIHEAVTEQAWNVIYSNNTIVN